MSVTVRPGCTRKTAAARLARAKPRVPWPAPTCRAIQARCRLGKLRLTLVRFVDRVKFAWGDAEMRERKRREVRSKRGLGPEQALQEDLFYPPGGPVLSAKDAADVGGKPEKGRWDELMPKCCSAVDVPCITPDQEDKQADQQQLHGAAEVGGGDKGEDEVSKLFDACDADGDGSLSEHELATLLGKRIRKQADEQYALVSSFAKELVEKFDTNKDRQIGRDEMKKLWKHLDELKAAAAAAELEPELEPEPEPEPDPEQAPKTPPSHPQVSKTPRKHGGGTPPMPGPSASTTPGGAVVDEGVPPVPAATVQVATGDLIQG